jgi:flagellar hook-associated protein 3 FlgL
MTSTLQQSILTAQQNLTNAELEVSTGTYADIGVQLGETTGQDFSLRSEQSLLQTISDTNNMASTRLSSTQNVLSNLQSSAQTVLNALISNTDQNGAATSLQDVAQNALQSLTEQLNTTVDGQYIFGGINSGQAPITDYYGSSAANQTAVNNAFSTYFGFSQSSSSVSSITSAQMSDFLSTQFSGLFQGANWTSDWSAASDTTISSQISDAQTLTTSVSANQSTFQDLAQAYTMVASLGTANLSADALQTLVTQATTLVQDGISGLTNIQTGLGVTQDNITSANNQMSVQMNILTTQIDNLEQVNPYQASTQVTDLQTQIETSFSLTSQLQKLSLVNYI